MAAVSDLKPSRVREVPPAMNAPRPATASPPPAQPKPVVAPLPTWRQGFRAAVPWVLAVFLICLAVQVFLAGIGLTEVGNQGMELHMAFVHYFEFVPILVALCGFLGADKSAGWAGVVLMVLVEAQYAFIGSSIAVVRAMHPVNALALFGVTLVLLLNRPLWTPTPKPVAVAR